MPPTSYPPTEEQRSCIVRFLLTPSEDEELRRLAKRRGIGMSELIRRVLCSSTRAIGCGGEEERQGTN